MGPSSKLTCVLLRRRDLDTEGAPAMHTDGNEAKERDFTRNQPCWCLALGLPMSGTVRKQCLPGLWYFAIAALTETKTVPLTSIVIIAAATVSLYMDFPFNLHKNSVMPM